MLLLLFVLTCTEQRDTSIGVAVKREITQGLVERHGVDKGIVFADNSCKFYDYETCEEIDLSFQRVRCTCVLCMTRAVYSVAHLSSTSPPIPSPPRMSLTLHAATGEGRRHSAAVREPGPIQAPEEDQLGKQGYVMGVGGA